MTEEINNFKNKVLEKLHNSNYLNTFETINKDKHNYLELIKAEKIKFNILCIIVVVIITLSMVPTFLFSNENLMLISFIFLTILVPLIFYADKKKIQKIEMIKRNKNNKFKKIFYDIINECFPGEFLWSEKFYEHKYIEESCVIPQRFKDKYFKNSDDDVFCGTYKSVKFNIVETQYLPNDGGEYCTYYTVIKLDLNKTYKGHTVIFEPEVDEILPNNIFTTNQSNLSKITLEDIEFNKKFRIYSDDQIKVRYIFTPAFIERFKKVKNIFNTQRLNCAIYKNSIYFGMETNNIFEFDTTKDKKQVQVDINKILDEITSLIKLIDILSLDNTTSL